MTFFMMRNRFQNQPKTEADEAVDDGKVTTKAKAALSAGAGSLMNSLFGPSKQRASSAPRKNSQASDQSDHSRASSGNRSASFPPKRISFDEDDFDNNLQQSRPQRTAATHHHHHHRMQHRSQSSRETVHRGGGGVERDDDQSSGTTDPPDDLPTDEGLDEEQEDAHAAAAADSAVKSDHGSDTSGPDSPEEVHSDDDLVLFMRQFVEHIFQTGHEIDADDKTKFGEYARSEPGRLWFARFVNSQRINQGNKLSEPVFYRLVQFTAIVLFECYQEEDYGPAKTLMNICFTFYKEGSQGSARTTRREFLYHFLRKQAIWHSLKFWNAAYFDATQSERARRAQREEWSNTQEGSRQQSQLEQNPAHPDDFVYRTLGDFIHNMRAFHVAKDSVMEFVRKQSHTLAPEQVRTLRDRVDEMCR